MTPQRDWDALLGKLNKVLLTGAGIGVLFFLIFPVFVVVPMSFSDASSLKFPPTEFSFRWYQQVFSNTDWINAIQTSFGLSLLASSIALVLGSLAAYGLVRGTMRGKKLLHSNFIAPLIIPPVILAVALYMGLAAIGWLGSFAGLLLAHTLLAIPYVVLIMSVAIQAFDIRIEQVAFTLGASWLTMFTRVLLPNLVPSAMAAWIFAFITSFDEVVITNFIAGTYDTIPKRMFNELILQVSPGITAIATVLIVISLVLMSIFAKVTFGSKKR